ncbi:TonB-dependent receptor [Xanthomonas citri]|uniref:TonB-dependent receptor n=1 Tax=Xanthomonas citri TaxID=346 RepID=UPI001CBE4C0E|nr:TonB-dependent receptor [Xanthomonas citri]MBZ3928672.1 TonB-dependent receptor [Xanthomonas citri pv. thirumalacharii]
MNCKSNKLRDAVVLALVVGVAAPTAAFAQESTAGNTTNLDRIEITGSRIRQVDVETAQPVLTISRQDIQAQGFNSVADILQNISAAGSPTFSRSSPLTSNQEAGGSYIDLRNLGAQRTLVLVNGKRLGISPNGYQDVSSIPTVIVERIEVLKDGASSIYGSDAMAGVINIITRKNFDGAQANAYVGQYSEGDGQKQTYDFMVGFTGERGSVTIGAEYHKEDGVWARNRPFTEDTYPGRPELSTTTVGQWGNWRVGNSGSWFAPNRGGDALGASDFHPQNAQDVSRSSDQMHLLTPLERRSLYVNANYDITDKVRFTSDLGYVKRESTRQIAGYPTQSTAISAPMSALSYFNPTGGTSPVNWRRRGWEVPRTTDTDLTTWRFTAALEGAFEIGERFFDWDAGYLYNENDTTIVNNGNFYIPAVRSAVGPSFVNSQGQVQCGSAASPIALTSCVPWNPFAGFGTGAVANSLDDPAVRDYLFREEHALGNTKTNSYFANISGSLFTLPAGDLAFALGYEYRKEQGAFSPDAIAQSGDSTNLASGPTSGQYSLDEFYGELNIPLLADLPFAKELTFNVASRYSDYDTFGNTTNNKFGLKWRPFDDLLVRATRSEGFRAPTIGDLFGGGSQTFTSGFIDPCDSVYGVARGSARCLQDVAANYRQLQQGFVPTVGVAAQTPVPFNSGSNPNLLPETSESKTVGLVYSPSYAPGLSIAVDWWNIRIDSTLVSDTPNLILEDCYVNLIESRCANFSRDPATGIVSDLTYGLRNAGYTETEGFDIDLNYALETEFGRFGVKWATTYVSKYESKATNDADTVPTQSNGMESFFRIRSNANVSWSINDWSVNWGVRYFSGTREDCYFDDRCTDPNYASPSTQGLITPLNRVGASTFHDVQLSWKAPWNATVALGANNVFNHVGGAMYSQQSSNFAYYGGYDIGRFIYARYQQNF